MVKFNFIYFLLLFLFPLVTLSQEVIEEVIPVDTSFITYRVIHKETKGDFFEIKRYVFADDTSVVAIEKNFSNGHQNGLTRVYYPSGNLRIKALYGNDQLQGEWILFDEAGKIMIKGVYNFGLKHGYWAYKKERTYGRYVKGKRHRNWKKRDANGVKYKAWYWKGKMKRGADIFKDDYVTYADTVYVASENGIIKEGEIALNVDEKYVNVVKYFVGNYYLRKVTKDYFRPNKKRRRIFVDEHVDYDKDVFKFQVSPLIVPVDISYFLAQKKLVKPTIDSLLDAKGEALKEQLNLVETKKIQDLQHLSTEEKAPMILYFSSIIDRLVTVEFLENENIEQLNEGQIYSNKKNVRMKALILLDKNNNVMEVEYQERDW